jgi:hypothetical protein
MAIRKKIPLNGATLRLCMAFFFFFFFPARLRKLAKNSTQNFQCRRYRSTSLAAARTPAGKSEESSMCAAGICAGP